MTIGIDTDVFVSWTMAGAARPDVARAFMQRQVAQGRGLAFTSQVIFEFVHIVTDPRRGFVGIITLKDIVEEIFGELAEW